MQWFCQINEQQVGPLSEGAIGELYASGTLQDSSLVRPDGTDEWMTYREALLDSEREPVLAELAYIIYCFNVF